ncbi:unnamed protein product [Urochloa decumbens]|uniref:WRKY domain-containing protein n=1 Tax=Urochloa decumbens TaxID=240449 RepID=A0ABC8YYS9_9POAL
MAAAASSSATPTITFSFQPSPPPPTSSLAHHGVLGYSSLLLDHPTTATTTSSSSSHAPSPTLHHLHAPHVSPPTRSSPPPHPWSTCNEGHDQAGQGRHRGKGAAVSEGFAAPEHNGAAAALGVGAVRMKKASGGGKARRKVREPRFCFKTMSDVDVLDDGYKWRKYGQKVVKNTQHPRTTAG